MNQAQLLELYPNAQLKEFPSASPSILSLATGDAFLWFEKKSLAPSEISLLKALFPMATNPKNHPWYHYLFEQQSLTLDRSYRIIQLHVSAKDDFLQKEWQETLLAMFYEPADFFFYSQQDALLIEPKGKNFLPVSELNGIFQSLDIDFEITTNVFVGAFHAPSQDFGTLFAEERKIFLTEKRSPQNSQAVFSLQDVALHYFTTEGIKENLLIQNYQLLLEEMDMEEIILALWNHLGNISSAAKTLFLHRNTLKYRIEKFQEATGFNLKQANDLLFCYLLIIQMSPAKKNN